MTYEEFVDKLNAQEIVRPKKQYCSSTQGPRDLDLEACGDVLDGDFGRLMEAFRWTDTPQGSSYWDNIHEGHRDLTTDDSVYIQSLIERYG